MYWMVASGLAMVIASAQPQDKTAEDVYCLAVEVAWNGQKIKAGRLPAYGMEIPNVSYERGYEPKRSRAYPLSPLPVIYLEQLFGRDSGQSMTFLSQPNVPLAAGELTVTIRIETVPRHSVAKHPRLASSAKRAARFVQFVAPVVKKTTASGIETDWNVLHTATASPGRPASYTFKLGPFVAPPVPAISERSVLIGQGESQIELSIRRFDNQAWTFDWSEPPDPP
jgi:hypothetical protein